MFSIVDQTISFDGQPSENLSYENQMEVHELVTSSVFFKSTYDEILFEDCDTMTFFGGLATVCYLLKATSMSNVIVMLPDSSGHLEMGILSDHYYFFGDQITNETHFSVRDFDESVFAAMRVLEKAYIQEFPNRWDLVALTHSLLIPPFWRPDR